MINNKHLTLCLITANSDLAISAQQAGVDRIMVDLEKIGKAKRQKGLDLYLSNHKLEDVRLIKQGLYKAQLLVRINPLYFGTSDEIEDVIKFGAQIVMLPMFESSEEVSYFIKLVRSRVKISLLLENKTACENIESIVKVPGIDEIHIGLNDLCLSYGNSNIFDVLCNGVIERLSDIIRAAGIKFGFGGVTDPNSKYLPISADSIIAAHAKYSSSVALLGQSFKNNLTLPPVRREIVDAVTSIRASYNYWSNVEEVEHIRNSESLKQKLARISRKKIIN